MVEGIKIEECKISREAMLSLKRRNILSVSEFINRWEIIRNRVAKEENKSVVLELSNFYNKLITSGMKDLYRKDTVDFANSVDLFYPDNLYKVLNYDERVVNNYFGGKDRLKQLLIEILEGGYSNIISKKEKEILVLRYKLLYTYVSIAKLLGMYISQVRQSEEKALRKLRYFVNSKVVSNRISPFDLSVRAYNCLMRAGICSNDVLVRLSKEDLMKIRNMGNVLADEVLAYIEKLKSEGY